MQCPQPREMALSSFANTDVANRRRHQNAFRAFERTQHELDGKLASILASSGEFNSRTADLLRSRIFRRSKIISDQPFREPHRNDVHYLAPCQLIPTVSELFLSLQIQEHDYSILIDHQHGIGSCFKQPTVLRLRLLAFAQIVAELRKAP